MVNKIKMSIIEKGIITDIKQISGDIWDMTVAASQIARNSKPGQFVHVKVNNGFKPFLRRPLSIGPVNGDTLRLIFLVKGGGTQILAKKNVGEEIDMIGPLGSAFRMPKKDEFPIFMAGGIGIVPLLFLDDCLTNDIQRLFLLGLRSRSFSTVSDDELNKRSIYVSSDDGSIGFKGNVIELLTEQLDNNKLINPIIYSCGPGIMLAKLKEFCEMRQIPAYVSLEVPMGCGVGACQSCAVPKADGDGYYLVCQDGPVFDASLVNLNHGELP
ncbi:dihydroorotate dehydrogenase electron transfer subunit [bacterium]|nr:dihydroorotate dehydrogenase electron transfer subunit [bacterium]